MSLFQRLFPGLASRRNGNPTAKGTDRAAGEPPWFRVCGPGAPTPREIDSRFVGLLLGVNSLIDIDLNPFELEVLERFDKLLSSRQLDAQLLPRLPGLIPGLLAMLRRGESSAAEIAAEIARDSALVADVLRLANSPWYRIGRPVESLEQAVVHLGEEGIRQVIATAAFRPLFRCDRKAGHFACLGIGALWQQNILVSRAADCIARSENADRFQAFLAGLLSSTGLMILVHVMDRHFTGSHAPRSLLFSEHLLLASRRLSTRVASEWDMPAEVVHMLEEQARSQEMAALSTAGQILFVAEKMGRLHALKESGRYAGRYDEVSCQIDHGIADNSSHCFERLRELGSALE